MKFFSSICTPFNNREIAIGILLILLITFALTKKRFRKSIKSLLKTLLKIKIIIFILIIAGYGCAIVMLLITVNYWNLSLLKDTIIWYCLPGFIMTVKYVTSNDSGNLVKRIIVDNIELLVIFEFIVNFYVFPLLVEIFIIPIITFIVLLDVISTRDIKYKNVSKFLRILQFLIGTSIFIYSTYHIIKDFNNFGNINTLKEFLLPFILTITFIPLICFMILYSRYESFFCRLDYYYKDDKKLRRYIKKSIIKNCFLNYKRIKIINLRWMNFRNSTDVDNFLESFK